MAVYKLKPLTHIPLIPIHIYSCKMLDKIQSEAARIVSRATKLVSLHALYEEVGWESLEKRQKHKLLLLYKMFNNLSPLYLCSLIPPTVDTKSSYNLRNAHNIRTIHSRTTQYFNSFLLSTIREWNTLPLDVRNCDSIISFKRKLNSDINVVPKYFLHGSFSAYFRNTTDSLIW